MAEESKETLSQDAAAPAEADSESTEEQVSKSDVIDLDKVEKFVFNGEELTPEELNRHFMRQQDYTRKTQEIAQERKFIDNLQADLEYVASNPDKVDAFKQTYPEKFHKYLDLVKPKQADYYDEDEVDEGTIPKHVAEKLKKLDAIEKKLSAQEREREMQEQKVVERQIDDVINEFSPKYPFAPEAEVLAVVDAIAAENAENPHFKMTKSSWERVFKSVNAHFEKHYEQTYSSRVKAQLKDSEEASDGAPGGLAPGRAPKNLKLGDVADYMIQDLAGKAR